MFKLILCACFLLVHTSITLNAMEESDANLKACKADTAISSHTLEWFMTGVSSGAREYVESKLRANPEIVNEPIRVPPDSLCCNMYAGSYLLYGARALHLASFLGHTEIVDLLLNHGADVSLTDGHGRTALGVVKDIPLWLMNERERKRYGTVENLLEVATKCHSRIILVWLHSDYSARENLIYRYPGDLVHIMGAYI